MGLAGFSAFGKLCSYFSPLDELLPFFACPALNPFVLQFLANDVLMFSMIGKAPFFSDVGVGKKLKGSPFQSHDMQAISLLNRLRVNGSHATELFLASVES
jgi:hypothetical protein